MPNLDPWETIDLFLKSRGIQVGKPQLNQTTGGNHAVGSLHYLHRARDYSPNPDHPSDMRAIAAALTPLALMPLSPIHELFYTPFNLFIKDGKRLTPSDALAAQHRDHLHVSLVSGADMRKFIVVASIAGGGAAVLILLVLLFFFRR